MPMHISSLVPSPHLTSLAGLLWLYGLESVLSKCASISNQDPFGSRIGSLNA